MLGLISQPPEYGTNAVCTEHRTKTISKCLSVLEHFFEISINFYCQLSEVQRSRLV